MSINNPPPGIEFLSSFTEANPVDQLRLYDDQIKRWVLTFSHPDIKTRSTSECAPNGQPGPMFTQIATPDRPFAEMRNLYNKQLPERERRRDPIIRPDFPACSITRMGPQKDMGRRRHRGVFRRAGWVSDQQKEVYQIPYPDPWNIPYQVDVTAINRRTLNLVQTWMMLQFDDDRFYVTVDFRQVHAEAYKYPYVFPVRFDSLDDTSDLEVGDGERFFRLTLTVTVEAMLMRPVRKVPVVHTYNYDFYEYEEARISQAAERMPEFTLAPPVVAAEPPDAVILEIQTGGIP